MTRIISLIALLATAFLTSPVLAQMTPALKPAVNVAASVVAIGDLIANSGSKSEIALFRAPDLGETGKVSAQDILDAAAVHGLRNIDTGGLAYVSVTRAGRAVNAEEMREPLTAALVAKAGLDEPDAIQVELDPAFAVVHMPVEADGAIEIQDAVWHPEREAFDAALVIRRIDGRDERRAIRGRAVETVPVVLTQRPIQRGAVISAADIVTERKPKSEARAASELLSTEVIGKEARRTLREGQPLRGSDLVEPTLVKSGAAVSIILKSGSLTLTATAQALRDGKLGETISVMNVQSKRSLQAVVSGPNEVTVNSPRTVVSAAK